MRFKLPLLLIIFLCRGFASQGYFEPWGRDADLRPPALENPAPPRKESTAVFLAKKVILFHQRVISPVDGPRSHFFPCSSKYMKDAMIKHGFITGFLMGCDRLLRENKDPWVYRNVLIGDKLIKYDPPK